MTIREPSDTTVRYRKGSILLGPVALTYGLWRADGGWKICFSATHPADAVLRFE